jgi:hypothetical protein
MGLIINENPSGFNLSEALFEIKKSHFTVPAFEGRFSEIRWEWDYTRLDSGFKTLS